MGVFSFDIIKRGNARTSVFGGPHLGQFADDPKHDLVRAARDAAQPEVAVEAAHHHLDTDGYITVQYSTVQYSTLQYSSTCPRPRYTHRNCFNQVYGD